jgi:hypothetical protein
MQTWNFHTYLNPKQKKDYQVSCQSLPAGSCSIILSVSAAKPARRGLAHSYILAASL